MSFTFTYASQAPANAEATELRCVVLTNRAACFLQLKRHKECIEVQPSSTTVL